MAHEESEKPRKIRDKERIWLHIYASARTNRILPDWRLLPSTKHRPLREYHWISGRLEQVFIPLRIYPPQALICIRGCVLDGNTCNIFEFINDNISIFFTHRARKGRKKEGREGKRRWGEGRLACFFLNLFNIGRIYFV